MSGRTYSDVERAEALDLAAAIGVERASKELGLPSGTLYSWRKRTTDRAGAVVHVDENLGALTWEQRRTLLVPKLGRVAELVLDAAERAARADRGRDARDFMVAAGVAIDKTELISGRATSRTESASLVVRRDESTLQAQIAALRSELGEPDGR